MKAWLPPELVASMKLARHELQRPSANVALADGVLAAVLAAIGSGEEQEAPAPEVRADSITIAARRLGYSAKHLRSLIAAGRLDGAIIGEGRATRVIVSKAIELLGNRIKASTHKVDPEEAAALAWARRSDLRVVDGGR
jgi:hypothetical protein